MRSLDAILVKGIDGRERPEDKEGDEGRPLTVTQLASLGHVIINAARNTKLKIADDIITDGQADDSFMMFNTRTGNHAIIGAYMEVLYA